MVVLNVRRNNCAKDIKRILDDDACIEGSDRLLEKRT